MAEMEGQVDAGVDRILQHDDGHCDLRGGVRRHGVERKRQQGIKIVGRRKAYSSCGTCVIQRACSFAHSMCDTTTTNHGDREKRGVAESWNVLMNCTMHG